MSNDSDDLNPLKISQNGDGNIHSKITTDCSSKFRTVLIIMAVIVSAMAMLFVLHEETDSSSAGLIDTGWCGEHTWYQYYSDNILFIEGSGAMYNYNLELCSLMCARISAYACEGQMTHFFEGRVK